VFRVEKFFVPKRWRRRRGEFFRNVVFFTYGGEFGVPFGVLFHVHFESDVGFTFANNQVEKTAPTSANVVLFGVF